MANCKGEHRFDARSLETVRTLFGSFDENIKIIESELDVRITQRDHEVCVMGSPVAAQAACDVMERLVERIELGENIDRQIVKYTLGLVEENNLAADKELMKGVVAVTYRGKQIKARTVGQKKYIDALGKSTVTLCVGPAGTGKTYLAIGKAVVALKNKEVSRIILTRPAVEAGERLGFLPGDLQQKVDPYLRPLYDALGEYLGPEAFARLQENGTIEVAPLAYMRGRTLSESYIILDEAQNCTREQMKMFLTRFGDGSKVVVTGDMTQIDLPPERTSGLSHALKVLRDVEGVNIIRLDDRDVVRNEIVQNIIRAYERAEQAEKARSKRRETQK